MPVYVEKVNGDVDQPTNRANIGQSAFSKVRQKKKGRDLQYQVCTHRACFSDSTSAV